ncbi:hypothetical protein [Sphaerisporangium sp. NPDC051011]|uniref:hypothetical protein n=1 Tax=Sphaerisporangium sp. NPDC051011 TaxID=3155792 RepID=UPI0033C5AA52
MTLSSIRGTRTALRAVRVFAAAAVLLVTAHLAPAGASAIDPSRGLPGFCPDGNGVTVVVDFQGLGGTPIVRCDPRRERGTGLDALKGAGFQIDGVRRWGEAFICRIENRPSAVEQIPVKGNEGYREACIDTPPAAGYWSYWHAGNNCAWKYSQWGVKNRDFIPGGFEGWSFSLNATADTNPKPRIAAVRPGTEGGPCNARDEPAPTSNDPSAVQPRPGGGDTRQDSPAPDPPATQDPAPRANPDSPAAQDPAPRTDPPAAQDPAPRANPDSPAAQAPAPHSDSDSPTAQAPAPRANPGSPAAQAPARRTTPDSPAARDVTGTDPARPEEPGGSGGSGPATPSGQDSPPGDGTVPPPLPRTRQTSVPDDPSRNVAFTGGEDAPDVTELVREQSGASDRAPWVAAAAIVVLGAATWLTARHRRRARDA